MKKFLFCLCFLGLISSVNADIVRNADQVLDSVFIAKDTTTAVPPSIRVTLSSNTISFHITGTSIAVNNWYVLMNDNLKLAQSTDIAKLNRDITINISTNILKLNNDLTINNSTNFLFLELDNLKLAQSTDIAKIRQDFIALVSSHFAFLELDNLKISQSTDIAGLRLDMYGISRSTNIYWLISELYGIARSTDIVNLGDRIIVNISTNISRQNELIVNISTNIQNMDIDLKSKFYNPNSTFTAVNFTSTVTLTNTNLNVTIQNTTMTFTNQSISDSRYFNKVSSGTAGFITGVTSASIVIAGNVTHWSFKCKNEINTNYFRIDNTLMGYQCELSDGDTDSETVDIPQPITFTLSNLGTGTTVQYVILKIK